MAGIAFEDALPAREFLSYRGQRHFPGLWWLATTGRHVGYESWLERDHVMALDFDRAVTGVSSQPFTLSWGGRSRRVSHTPDYFARLADGSGVVVDVRPADRVGPQDAVKFEATAAACALVGNWSFRLVHELEPVLAANVRWLSGYRHPRHGDPDLGPLLWRVFADGAALLAGVSKSLTRSADCRSCSICCGAATWSPTWAFRLATGHGSAVGSRRERACAAGRAPGRRQGPL